MRINILFIFAYLLIYPIHVYAYIGPGAGFGVIASLLGIFGSIFLFIFAILYYPIKRYILKRKSKKKIKKKIS